MLCLEDRLHKSKNGERESAIGSGVEAGRGTVLFFRQPMPCNSGRAERWPLSPSEPVGFSVKTTTPACPHTSQRCLENCRQDPSGSSPLLSLGFSPRASWRGATGPVAPLPSGATALQPAWPTGCLLTLITTDVQTDTKCSMWAPGNGAFMWLAGSLCVLSAAEGQDVQCLVWSCGTWMREGEGRVNPVCWESGD